MEVDNQKIEQDNEVSSELSNTGEFFSQKDISDRKDEDEEEEEEEEEDKIVEKSHNSRFHKRNKRFPKQIEGVDNAFVAIEPKSGKEVIWNECILPEKKTDKEVAIVDQHVGQLLSVLMFLHRLGVAHGNLTKESIYYQNSGNLRVGLCKPQSSINYLCLVALGKCLDQKSEAFDVYSLGVVSLEIAVWTPTEFPPNLDLTERCQQMISRLDNNNQKSFIEACFDTGSATKCLIKRLLNHPAVTEVPILKLLSARMIVNSSKVWSYYIDVLHYAYIDSICQFVPIHFRLFHIITLLSVKYFFTRYASLASVISSSVLCIVQQKTDSTTIFYPVLIDSSKNQEHPLLSVLILLFSQLDLNNSNSLSMYVQRN
ncbi:unnamed protein product [Schistosoma margrebowiei]|uniref:Uncharacterized protein n=1 Tax=Schistosoma margrebowiei TaxID=48269 RepID=A0A183N8Y9_9TREM|nr:unnamed protein product [Schistosoma margrebowiei]